MKLELLHRPAVTTAKRVRLLFVHGISTGAWVWERSFLPYFAEHGYESFALSLRGHGNSEGRDRIRDFSLGDFADDVAETVKKIGGDVVIVGHSLGGGVLQNYIKRGGAASGVVLLCSAPPHGLLRASTIMAARNPQLWNELAKGFKRGLRTADLDIVEAGLFSEPPPPDIRRLLHDRFDDIAETASRQVIGWTPFAPFPWGMPKMLIIGGEKDEFVPASDVRLTAIYYGERSLILPDGVHAIMMDRRWQEAAKPIAAWLDRNFS